VSHDTYELIALAMRYVFMALMLWIVWRACRGALVDARRAAKLRRLSPMTGLCGEMVVIEGDERARRGMRYPVIREGLIGTSRRADVRIRHSSVRRRHAYFQLTESGLKVRGHAGARLINGAGKSVREMMLADGDSLRIGRVRLLLVLSLPEGYVRKKPARASAEMAEEDTMLFPEDDWPEEWDAPRSVGSDMVSPIFDKDGEEDWFEVEEVKADGEAEISPIFRKDEPTLVRRRKRKPDAFDPGRRRHSHRITLDD